MGIVCVPLRSLRRTRDSPNRLTRVNARRDLPRRKETETATEIGSLFEKLGNVNFRGTK